MNKTFMTDTARAYDFRKTVVFKMGNRNCAILSLSQFSPRLKVLLIVFSLENVYELVAFGAELVFFAWVWSSSFVLAVDFD